jgi:hypothetical protein
LISKLAILHCSGHGVDARFNGVRFGPILLKANDHLHYGLLPNEPDHRVATRDDFAKIITEMVAVQWKNEKLKAILLSDEPNLLGHNAVCVLD